MFLRVGQHLKELSLTLMVNETNPGVPVLPNGDIALQFSIATNHRRTCLAIILLGGHLPFKSEDIHHIHRSFIMLPSLMSKINARTSLGRKMKGSPNGISRKIVSGSQHNS